ncbi:MAG: AAA domain-containing protein [Lautropia sp.]|nr:AAA domain-containing protein [Lautropia sp.]
MNLSELPYFSNELVRFRCEDTIGDWRAGESVSITAERSNNADGYLLRQGTCVSRAHVDQGDSWTASLLESEHSLWCVCARESPYLLVKCLEITGWMDINIDIVVDEKITDYLYSKGEIFSSDVECAVDWLRATFVLLGEGAFPEKPKILVGRFHGRSDDILELFGERGWRAQVVVRENRFCLKRLSKDKNKKPELDLACGQIAFVDGSVAKVLSSGEMRAVLEAAIRDKGGYLDLWRSYGELEWRHADKTAKELGSFRYEGVEELFGEEIRWRLKADGKQLKRFRQSWADLGLPGALDVEIEHDLLLEDGLNTDRFSPDRRESAGRFRGILSIERDEVILKVPGDADLLTPPRAGVVSYSLRGDLVIKRRRESAQERIQHGQGVMPQLRHLLQDLPVPSALRRREEGLSPYARACFKGIPTERQELALSVAINTPDIALIIGPPGTGKTQVIAALQRRLAELNHDRPLQHQVLISSYQHDAVDNALERSDVYGLPAVRIGGRSRGTEEAVDPVERWCRDKSVEVGKVLESRKSDDPSCDLLLQIDQKLGRLRTGRFSSDERRKIFLDVDGLLQKLADHGVRLDLKFRHQWEEFLEVLRRDDVALREQMPEKLLRLVRGLRTSAPGFADDGADRVYQLLRTLDARGGFLEDKERTLLAELADAVNPPDEALSALLVFKRSMIDRLLPDYRPPRLKRSLNERELDAIGKVESAIAEGVQKSRAGKVGVISAYLEELSASTDELVRSVREYSNIVGATCQKSAGREMSSLKALNELSSADRLSFDTVIVDEAARANPLDLLVPISMAQRRIILVGDHRQLPHLIQRDLEEELASENDLSEMQRRAYEQSLFERLHDTLIEQERKGGLKRVVMLDTQYRMHPTLGDFISQQFYEAEGLDAVRSGRPAEDFEHAIPGYEGRCAAWLDVPFRMGGEQRQGASRVRVAEAEAIAREVKRVADLCGPALSIGVISFYRSQVSRIWDEFVRLGVAERHEQGVRLSRKYRPTDGQERLRVGTVDAFQGKEFDVVFLSVVRSNERRAVADLESDVRNKLLNDKYGHLRVSNRLNVAMSRQRKLLVVVGDRGMASCPEAMEAVPALSAFLALCDREALNAG